jgi:hypothetical protein
MYGPRFRALVTSAHLCGGRVIHEPSVQQTSSPTAGMGQGYVGWISVNTQARPWWVWYLAPNELREQLVGRTQIMTVTLAIAATAMFAGLAVGTANTAWADQTMSGHYIKTETTQDNAQTATSDWYFTPCGDGCANVTSSTSAQGSQAHLVNGQWTMDQPGGTTSCPDGTAHPGATNAHYTWDPNTLTGTAQVTVTAAVCGFPAGYTQTDNIQLKQAP